MKLIAVFTHSGFTARLVSRYRPLVPIVAFSPEAETRRRMALIWGVVPRNIQDVQKVDGLAKVAEKRLLEERLVRKGEIIGIVAGTPMGIRGTTKFMKFHVIGGPARRINARAVPMSQPWATNKLNTSLEGSQDTQ